MSNYKKCNQCGRVFEQEAGGADISTSGVEIGGEHFWRSATFCEGCLTTSPAGKVAVAAIEMVQDVSRRDYVIVNGASKEVIEPAYRHHYCGIEVAGVCTCGLLYKLYCLGEPKAQHLYPGYEKEMKLHNATLREVARMHDRAAVGLLNWPVVK